MKTETACAIGLPAQSVRRLLPGNSGAIQGLFEKGLDYMLLVGGHAADPHTVEEEFLSVPPGKSYDDKFVFGIVDQQNEPVGLLDTLRRYQAETTWWIDTLLFVPEVRSQGLGQMVVRGFAEYVKANGGWAMSGISIQPR